MAPDPPQPAPTAPAPTMPLWAALESGVTELELALARGGQGITAVCLLIAAYVAVFVTRETGIVLGVVSTAALLFYTTVHQLMRRDIGVRVLRVLVPLFEVCVPATATWILVQTEGPAYALGSWVPPQLFCIFIAASILRLSAWVPAAMGGLAALTYGGIWWFAIRGEVDTDLLLHRSDMQITRMFSLALTGLACSAAVLGLRRAIGHANAQLREQDLFGKYRLGEQLASGGMGTVHEALYCPEGGFQRRVAIKLIHPHLARDASFVRRFRREAELSSLLMHPNIVGALDFGRVGATYFLAMEFVDGRTLFDILKERRKMHRPVSPRVVAWIGREIASALDHAHARATDSDGNLLRVIHRDLSPSNVLVDRSGRVRITDFGVARALGSAGQIHTRTLVGKPSYMAPEQLQEQPIDPRADLWSLGVVLWEALANERLFHRTHEGATLLAVSRDEIPPIDRKRPGLKAHWAPLFDGLLARDPAARFGTAADAIDILDAIVAVEGVPVPGELSELLLEEGELPALDLDETSEVWSPEPTGEVPLELDDADAPPLLPIEE